ncbi:MAG TPA: hypothetical protein VFJ74_17135 [Gemmatimonadaceae bacterium]|nr:hypothetical protein [Gemmatimonadaceae bacterium]
MPSPRPRLSLRHLLTFVPALVVALGVTGCSADSPTAAPATTSPAPRALLGLDPLVGTTTTLLTTTVQTVDGTVSGLLGLLTCSQQNQLTASKYIGPLGGSITVGDHKLVVPMGALTQTVYITATQQSGTIAEIDFQPHGLKFAKPASLTMSYSSCSTSSGSVQSIVYLNDSNQIIETPPSVDKATSDVVTASIGHFSGYAIATVRTGE